MPPRRIRQYTGRYALVDGIPYRMPIRAKDSPELMAGFSCDWEAANAMLPGNELHAFMLPNGRGILLITVIDYLDTSIGKYIEFSIAIGCTRGRKPAPRVLNALFTGLFGTGQYILDLPVSTEVSVKGGKGIWGMPKHQANLDFIDAGDRVSSQYEKDGQFVFRIEIEKPRSSSIGMRICATNYCQYRNMLMASYVYFQTKVGLNLFGKARATLHIGEHPNVAGLRNIGINPDPVFTAYMPAANGILDDHFQCWFLTEEDPPARVSEGLESVVSLGLGEEWLAPPSIHDIDKYRLR